MNGFPSPSNPSPSISFHPVLIMGCSRWASLSHFPTSHQILPTANFSGKKLPDIFLAFPQTISYCSSFFLPSITDEVTIYSIIFLVLESMELLFPFWRINILSWTCTLVLAFRNFLILTWPGPAQHHLLGGNMVPHWRKRRNWRKRRRWREEEKCFCKDSSHRGGRKKLQAGDFFKSIWIYLFSHLYIY